MAFRRGGDARSIPRVRIPGEHTRDRSVLVGKLAEILRDMRPSRKVDAMFIDMAFGSPIYERLRALGFKQRVRSELRLDAHSGPRQGQHAGLYVGPDEGLATHWCSRDRRKDGDGSGGPR